jgi:hypothetical protein
MGFLISSSRLQAGTGLISPWSFCSAIQTTGVPTSLCAVAKRAAQTRRPLIISGSIGAWPFAVDPDRPPLHPVNVWRPELIPTTVILTAAPSEFSCSRNTLCLHGQGIRFDQTTAGSRHIVLAEPEGDHRICLVDVHRKEGALAALIPMGGDVPVRLEATQRLQRRLCGRPAGPPPRAWRLTQQQRTRLTLMLKALDARRSGWSYRRIAVDLLDPEAAALPATIWTMSPVRARATRLVVRAFETTNGGYLRLLRGANA